MKKGLWLAIGTAAIIGLTGLTPADAGSAGFGGGYGPGYCGNCGSEGRQALSPEALQARDQFMTETTETRKQLAIRQAELRALMAQASPDEKRVAALTGEAFDLRAQLQQKATERGLSGLFGLGECRQEGAWAGMRGGRRSRSGNL